MCSITRTQSVIEGICYCTDYSLGTVPILKLHVSVFYYTSKGRPWLSALGNPFVETTSCQNNFHDVSECYSVASGSRYIKLRHARSDTSLFMKAIGYLN